MLLLILTFIILGLITPIALLSNLEGVISVNFLTMYAIVLFFSSRLTFTAIKGKRQLTLIFFYVFAYVFMGVQPLLSIWTNNFPHNYINFSSQMISFSIFLLLTGILGFEIGYFISNKKKRLKKMSIEKHYKFLNYKTLHKIQSLNFICTFLFIISMIIYGPDFFLGLRGGGFIFSGAENRESSQMETQLVVYGLRSFAASVLFIILYIWRYRSVFLTSIQLRKFRIILIYSIVLNLLISNPLNAPRLWFGSVLLTSFILIFKWNGLSSFLKWSSISSLGLLLLFSGLDPRIIFSYQILNGGEVNFTNSLNAVAASINNLPGDYNFDAFQMLYFTTIYTSKLGYSFGYQLLLPIFFWFPRSIWNSKPLGSPDIVASYAGFDSINVSSPLWAEGYINFGIFGVFVFLFIFGYFAKLSDTILSNSKQLPPFGFIVSGFFASNTIILLRGDITTGTMYLQLISLIIFVLLLFIQIPYSKSIN